MAQESPWGIVPRISTWVQVAGAIVLAIFLALSAPPSVDRTLAIAGLLVLATLIALLDHRRDQATGQRARVQGALAAYDDLIAEFRRRSADATDLQQACYGPLVAELERYRQLLLRFATP